MNISWVRGFNDIQSVRDAHDARDVCYARSAHGTRGGRFDSLNFIFIIYNYYSLKIDSILITSFIKKNITVLQSLIPETMEDFMYLRFIFWKIKIINLYL